MTSICILGIIICKFGYQKEFYLVILFETNKILKISFYYVFLPFGFTINLQIKSYKKTMLNIKK